MEPLKAVIMLAAHERLCECLRGMFIPIILVAQDVCLPLPDAEYILLSHSRLFQLC